MKRYLLDTHILLWALTEPRKLGPRVRDILEHEDVYVSVLSLWETLQKHGRGKLRLPEGSLVDAVVRAGARWLPLQAEHAEAGVMLDGMHADPIDRMLVGSARVEHMVLVTRDAQILERAAPVLGNLLLAA